jgi:hypothetical protein
LLFLELGVANAPAVGVTVRVPAATPEVTVIIAGVGPRTEIALLVPEAARDAAGCLVVDGGGHLDRLVSGLVGGDSGDSTEEEEGYETHSQWTVISDGLV